MFNKLFDIKDKVTIPKDTEVIIVSDMFVDEYLGGAELTTEALIKSSRLKTFKLKSSDVNNETLEAGMNKYWVFTNISQLDQELIPTICANINYSVVEYDYKFCKYRSVEKHKHNEKKECDCHNQVSGKMISAFLHGANTVFYMSVKQMDRYHERFPFLKEETGSRQYVISSVFSDEFFSVTKLLRKKYKEKKSEEWLVLGSNSWIKGTDNAIEWCEKENLEYSIIQNMNHLEVLEKLAGAKGLVYLPKGGDTCPRLVIEAQLLGCELKLNSNVQHQSEFPFCQNNIDDIEIYLYGNREKFWAMIDEDMNYFPNISGYLTTRNCVTQEYPFESCINSMKSFCTEIIVMDGGSSDGTMEILEKMSKEDPRIKVFSHDIMLDDIRVSVQDGLQKGRARAKCTGKFCWQMDADEEVDQTAIKGILDLCRQFPKFIDIVALPVVEYWGDLSKVRIDVNPWKWRITRNKPNITHGIPGSHRKADDQGKLFAAFGTDGCDYIDRYTLEVLPHATFYTKQIHELRIRALNGDKESIGLYEEIINDIVKNIPTVKHYSWLNIERKIRTYKNYWQTHWESLYDIEQEDSEKNNMFFDKPWSLVTDEEIHEFAKELSEKTGGHIFHTKVDLNKPTPHIKVAI